MRMNVERFSRPADEHYFANLRAHDAPSTLRGLDEMVLVVRGGGGLHATRVYLRAGDDERWRSPEIPLTNEWVEHRVPIEAFGRQTGGRLHWQAATWEEPDRITMLQIKVGYAINTIESTGHIDVLSIDFR